MQELHLKIKGLYTHPSDLANGDAPEGALTVAKNIVVDHEDIAEPRRGFSRCSAGFTTTSDTAKKLTVYQNYLFAHLSSNVLAYYTTLLAANSTAFTSSGSWTTVSGSYSAPSGTKMRFATANQNLYLTTSAGIFKLDAYNSTPVLAGAYKALDVYPTIVSATGNWLTNNYSVAYRVVWGYKDANKNLILGAPSQSAIVTNTSGSTSSVQLKVTIPSGVTTAWFFQVYRSAMVSGTPNDELGLVYEANPTSGQISAGSATLTDIVPDTLRGATIYTAASQQGLANGYEHAPLAKDIAVFRNVMFYANTVSKHREYVSLLAVGGTNGLQNNETITINGVVYTAKTATTPGSEDTTNRYFALVTGGSASQNITDTANSLVRLINAAAASTTYAYYLSGPADLPGQMLFEERSIGGSGWTTTSSNTTCWSPALGGSGDTSTNDTNLNGVYYSLTSQPESVPLANFFLVGSADKQILRILPLRDSLFILKEDGVFRLSGLDSASFRVDPFDATTHLLAPDSAVVLNNQIFCLTDQGVVSISESGVQVRSRPIEYDLLSLQGQNYSVLKSESFGVNYDTERKYILFVPTLAADATPTQAYVFNTFTNTWTNWPLSKTCGIVNPGPVGDDKFYLGDAATNYVNQERKSFSYQDYVDYGFPTNITAVSGMTINIDNSDLIAVGDVIYQSSSVYSTVTAVDAVAGTVTTSVTAAFATGATDVLKAISSQITWVPVTAGNPGIQKQYSEISVLFKSDFTGNGTLSFVTDAAPAQETETLTGTPIGTWGLFAWGGVAWGGTNNRRPIRVYVPSDMQRCSQLTIGFQHSTGYAKYQLNGISLIANQLSSKVSY